ncbi:MAG: hypothetical protein FWF46_03710 [Oscillospiraceae bacterium]|nr:hypothetical protein [Oscillospiraceae bacterium]
MNYKVKISLIIGIFILFFLLMSHKVYARSYSIDNMDIQALEEDFLEVGGGAF